MSDVVAIDVGGTTTKAGRFVVAGPAVDSLEVPTVPTVAAIAEIVEALRTPDTVGVGVIVPGVIADGVVTFSANLDWRNVPLRGELESLVGLPVSIDHDVTAAARAECTAAGSALFVALGTGIAGAHVTAGRCGVGRPAGPARSVIRRCTRTESFVLRPKRLSGGVRLGGRDRPALRERPSASDGSSWTAERSRAGSPPMPIAGRVWQDAVDALAIALATDVLVFDPAEIVLGGGLAEADEALLDPASSRARRAAGLAAGSTGSPRSPRCGSPAGSERRDWPGRPPNCVRRTRMTTVIGARRIVTPSGVLDRRLGRDRRRADRDRRNRVAAPRPRPGRFVVAARFHRRPHARRWRPDVTRSASTMAAAVAYHRRFGTTRTLVSLMAQPLEALYEQLGWVAALRDAGLVLGAHLEGPFLASARCGAQDPDSLIAPDPLVLLKLLEAGQGAVRTMTLAPELPGALELIAELRAARVVAAVGHTDATYEQAAVGFGAGATLATHLFNAMGSISQRAPGPSFAALDSGAYVELINDGAHVHDVPGPAGRSAGRRPTCPDHRCHQRERGRRRHYTLGDQTVVVRDGRRRWPVPTGWPGARSRWTRLCGARCSRRAFRSTSRRRPRRGSRLGCSESTITTGRSRRTGSPIWSHSTGICSCVT